MEIKLPTAALAVLLLWLTGCTQEKRPAPSYVSAAELEAKPTDGYAKTDLSARKSVDPHAAALALQGDPQIALQIAGEFSTLNKLTETRYWLQIAAENGSGIAMQRLSVVLRDKDCVRANYWLRRGLATGQIAGRAKDANEKDLALYEKTCRYR